MSRQEPDVVLSVGFDNSSIKAGADSLYNRMQEMLKKMETLQERSNGIIEKLKNSQDANEQKRLNIQLGRNEKLVKDTYKATVQMTQAWERANEQILRSEGRYLQQRSAQYQNFARVTNAGPTAGPLGGGMGNMMGGGSPAYNIGGGLGGMQGGGGGGTNYSTGYTPGGYGPGGAGYGFGGMMGGANPPPPPARPAGGGGGGFGRGGGSPMNRGLIAFGFGMMGAGRNLPGARAAGSLAIGYGFGQGAGLAGAAAGVGVDVAIQGVTKLLGLYEKLYEAAFKLTGGHAQLQNTLDMASQTIETHFYPALKAAQDQEVQLGNWIDSHQAELGQLVDVFARLSIEATKFAGSLAEIAKNALLVMTLSPDIDTAIGKAADRVSNFGSRIGIMAGMIRQGGASAIPSAVLTGAFSDINPKATSGQGYVASLGGMAGYKREMENQRLKQKFASPDLTITDFGKQQTINETNSRTGKIIEETKALMAKNALEKQIGAEEEQLDQTRIRESDGRIKDYVGELEALRKIGDLKIKIAQDELDAKNRIEEQATSALQTKSDPLDKAQAEEKLAQAVSERVKAENAVADAVIAADKRITDAHISNLNGLQRIKDFWKLKENQVAPGDPTDTPWGQPMAPWDHVPGATPLTRQDVEDFNSRNMAKQQGYTPISNATALANALDTAINRFSAFNSVLGHATGSFAIFGRTLLDLKKIVLPNGQEVGSMAGGLGSIFKQKFPNPDGVGTTTKFTMSGFLQGAAAIGGIASSIFGVVGALRDVFTKAAKEMAQAIGKEVSHIEQVAGKTGKLNEAIVALDAQRTKALNDLGSKKGGQKELKDLLPQIDDALESIKKQQKDIVDGFTKGLSLLTASDPMAQLINDFDSVNDKVREFINAAGESEDSYAKAFAYIEASASKISANIQQEMEDARKAFFQGAEDEQGNLVSLEADAAKKKEENEKAYYEAYDKMEKQRAAMIKANDKAEKADLKAIAELQQNIIDLKDEEQKQITAITNEGIAEREKTTTQDKAQRIADLQDATKKQLEDIAERINGIEEERVARKEAYQENIDQLNEAETTARHNMDNTFMRINNEMDRTRDAYHERMDQLQKQQDKLLELENEEGGTIAALAGAWRASMEQRLIDYQRLIDGMLEQNDRLMNGQNGIQAAIERAMDNIAGRMAS